MWGRVETEEPDVSLLLVKPERQRLMCDDFDSYLLCILGTVILAEHVVSINMKQAKDMWKASVDKQPWANDYYKHMASGVSGVYILEGQHRAGVLKRQIRLRYQDEIGRITQELGKGFYADLVHGSDPGEAVKEARILHVDLPRTV